MSAAPDENLPTLDEFDEVVRIVQNHTDLFVRYSKGPAADAQREASYDYEAKVQLPGLSVATVVPEPWWPRATEEWVARRLCQYDQLGKENERFPWLLTGSVVGNGPDHEPLLRDVRPIARISWQAIEQARRWYAACFDQGQDSRS